MNDDSLDIAEPDPNDSAASFEWDDVKMNTLGVDWTNFINFFLISVASEVRDFQEFFTLDLNDLSVHFGEDCKNGRDLSDELRSIGVNVKSDAAEPNDLSGTNPSSIGEGENEQESRLDDSVSSRVSIGTGFFKGCGCS